jgi:hypothetical protein
MGHIPMLPTEIWHIILQYSISAPDLFDPDYMVDQFPPWVITNHRWSIQERYEKVEFSLETLRRVCRSWDRYLRRYVHRYVRMPDIVHGEVPLHYLKSATRVSFGDHHNWCCGDCKPELFGLECTTVPFFELCQNIFQQESPSRAQILDCGFCGYDIIEQVKLSRTFPNLVHIQGEDKYKSSTDIIKMIESLSSLRHIYTRLDWLGGGLLSLKSSTLTTLNLAFSAPNPSLTLFTDENLHLPALRHLHVGAVYYTQRNIHDEPPWLPLVKIVGKELLTLRLPWQIKDSYVGGELWRHCPKLGDLFPWTPTCTPPPERHPIHTIGVSHTWITNLYPLKIPDWPGLRTVRIDEPWRHWMTCGYGPLKTSQIEKLGSRIGLQDCMGESYTEYLSSAELEKGELYVPLEPPFSDCLESPTRSCR